TSHHAQPAVGCARHRSSRTLTVWRSARTLVGGQPDRSDGRDAMALGRLSSKGRAALDSLAGYGSVFARRSRVGDWSDESSGAAGNRRIPSFRKERKTRPRGSIPVSGCPEAASRFSFVDRTSVLDDSKIEGQNSGGTRRRYAIGELNRDCYGSRDFCSVLRSVDERRGASGA